MEKLEMVKAFFKLCFFTIFLMQMHGSVMKLMRGLAVDRKSITTIDKITKPVIFVCEENQFNYTKVKLKEKLYLMLINHIY